MLERRRFRVMKLIIDWMGGRTVAFATFFAIAGTTLAFMHKLDLSYAALVTAIQGLITARSIAQDRYPPSSAAQSVVPKENKVADLKVEITKESTT